jgi:hypothetical protein
MFLAREWTIEWMNEHCISRFGSSPRPYELTELWGLSTQRLASITSRVVFTSGLIDGWSAGGVLVNLSDTLIAFSAPNGARFLFLIDGATSQRLAQFDRVFDLFDGQDDQAVVAARTRYREARAAGHALTYWQQGQKGWEKK